MKQLIHFGAATASAYAYAQINPTLIEFLVRLSYAFFSFPRLCFNDCTGTAYETNYTFWQFWWFASWLAAYSICAFAVGYKNAVSRANFLHHLRYGPMAAFAVFLLLSPVAEWESIEKSKVKIRDYIENGSTSTPGPHQFLYVGGIQNYWNEYDSPEYKVYAETAAEGLQSDNPMARVRALKMSSRLYDRDRFPARSPFIEALQQGRNDKDLIFREEANEYIKEICNHCALNKDLDCYFILKALGIETSR
jgi:hypothetical protein